ncbi:MAG: hypothetical protein AAF368_16835 [Planctomycetota bacterium]
MTLTEGNKRVLRVLDRGGRVVRAPGEARYTAHVPGGHHLFFASATVLRLIDLGLVTEARSGALFSVRKVMDSESIGLGGGA